ncbi:hypothetical protein DIPPA_28398 [Diplonema papillatum]|nr:hypothetical protein DIPPA_17804 [Diplonema papillatum]KAJ9442656.1 hypothetical protein DIPPA_23568 [Diplonema papillatum]KAJ9451085.1 hypothetical protein DIPPA_16734 [Diplonema papillatum]KAJ9453372.1 hypothetical protein DIPPA_21165 [Diplonema papillatum]KAJ9463912.1 hypothetical protein DIPPA_03284 [Diplonema papillatum]
MCTLLAWKSASRWAEAAALSSKQFLRVAPEEIVIDWEQTPKGRRRNPFKPSRFAVIVGPLTPELAEMFQASAPFDELCSLTTTGLDSMWTRSPEMRRYSAHSIKRGAVTRLFDLIASGVSIPLCSVHRLAKHEEPGGTEGAISETTIRYGGNLLALARVLGTAKATKHL